MSTRSPRPSITIVLATRPLFFPENNTCIIGPGPSSGSVAPDNVRCPGDFDPVQAWRSCDWDDIMQIHQFSPGLSSYHPAIPLTVKSLFHLWALFIIRGDRRFHFRRDEIILITMEPTCPFSSAPLRSDHSLILSSLWVINLPCLLQPAPALPRHITPLPSHTDHHIFTLIDNLSPLSAHFNAIGALALGPWNLVVSIVFVICESRTLSDQFFFSTGTHEANRYSYRSKALIDRVLRFWGIPQYLPVDRLISRVREFNKLPSMFLKKKQALWV